MTKSNCPGIRRTWISLALHSDNTFETLENEPFGDRALSQVETKKQKQKIPVFYKTHFL